MNQKTFYAIKILKKGFSITEFRSFINEIEILQKLNDQSLRVPKIVDANFRGEYHKPGTQPTKVCYYVMELVEYGELFGLIKNGGPLSEDSVRYLFQGIITGKNG